jgi:hypothetical protein
LDGRFLRASGASVMASGGDGQREKLRSRLANWSLCVLMPKASAREFHQSNRPRLVNALLALRIEHTTGGRSGHLKAELSTLLKRGTFYFALTTAFGGGLQDSGVVSTKIWP